MATQNHLFIIGSNPYENGSKFNTKGNGSWRTHAPDVETALRSLFQHIPFPTEAVGRFAHIFLEGVSLKNVPAQRVIQVWSSEPEIVQRTADFAMRIEGNAMARESHHWHYHPHSNGEHVGLALEIPVEDVHKFIDRPAPAGLLMNEGDNKAVSPFGASLGALTDERRHKMQLAVTEARLETIRRKLSMEASARELSDRRKLMEKQLMLAGIYMAGVKSQEILQSGNRAPANEPYHVFQKRQFLDNEVGLLANLLEMDFADMPAMDEWLIQSGHWKKLLPFPRTILITRIKKEQKDYGGGLHGIILNHFNMEHVVFIRDGENVMRMGCDVTFDGELFPDPEQSAKVRTRVQEAIWNGRFKGERFPEASNRRKPFGLLPAAIYEEEPYQLRTVFPHHFPTMQEWLDSDFYTSEIDAEINRAVEAFVRERNAASLPFVVFLQGLVDNTNVLQIPPGTDLFNQEMLAKYFKLVFDFSYGLPTSQFTSRMAAAMDPHSLKIGDWIITPDPRRERSAPLLLLRVHSLKDGIPHVRVRALKKRGYSDEEAKREETVALERDFIPISLPQELVTGILDNRDWKAENRQFVPVLAQWEELHVKYSSPLNGARIELSRKGI